MSMIKTSRILGALCGGLILSASIAAQADEVKFKFQPEELQTSIGLQQLYKRLTLTVERQCTESGSRSLSEHHIEERCVDSLMSDYMDAIDDPRLEAYANQKSGWTRISRK